MPEIDPRLPQRLRVARADPALVGNGERGFTIAGTLAAALLALGTALDPDTLDEGAGSQANFAGFDVVLRRRAGGFDLLCATADGAALEDWLAAALSTFAVGA